MRRRVCPSSLGASATSSTTALPYVVKNYKAIGIGSGIGGAVAGCILIAIIVFCVRKRRRERGEKAGVVGVEKTHHGETPQAYVVEENKSPVELSTTERVGELAPNPLPVWELPGHDARTPRV